MFRALASVTLISVTLIALPLTGCSDSPSPEQKTSNSDAKIEPEVSAHSETPATEKDSASDGQYIFIGRYRCEGDGEFLLSVTDHSASLEIEGVTYELRQQPAASGAFYAGDLWQVHGKSEHALLIGQDNTRDCQLLSSADSNDFMPMENSAGQH